MSVTSVPNDYLCPITGQVMLDPVRIPCGHIFDRIAIMRWAQQLQAGSDGFPSCPMDRRNFIGAAQCPELKQKIYDFIVQNPHLFPEDVKRNPEVVRRRPEVVQRNLVDLEKNPANFSGRNIWADAYISGGVRHKIFYVPKESAPLFSTAEEQDKPLLIELKLTNYNSYEAEGSITNRPWAFKAGLGMLDKSQLDVQLLQELNSKELNDLGLKPLDNNVSLQQAITDTSVTGTLVYFTATRYVTIPRLSDRIVRDTAQALLLCVSALLRGNVVL